MILLNIFVVMIFVIFLPHKGFSAPPNPPEQPLTSAKPYLLDESKDQAQFINIFEGSLILQLK